MNSQPTLRLLSLGAGVQSSALLLLSVEGKLPKVDAAIFADTGWEPRAVYEHLDRLETEVAKPAGIPIHRVRSGDIKADALNPKVRNASIPFHVRHPEGSERVDGMMPRQCTSEYKLRPVREATRRLLGAADKDNGRPGRVPTGNWAETWIGFSTDEADRAERRTEVGYSKSRFPLLELGMSRSDCSRYLRRLGFEGTPKSACVGCPYRVNGSWRHMRDTAPADFADAVAFDAAMRADNAPEGLRGQVFLHRSLLPLSVAPIDRVPAREWAERQGDLLELALQDVEDQLGSDFGGCSPWSCSSGAVIEEPEGDAA